MSPTAVCPIYQSHSYDIHLWTVTPRRWLDQCNPLLSNLITETLKLPKEVWLKDLFKLQGLLEHADDPTFQKKWLAVKQSNKERLAHYVETTLGVRFSTIYDMRLEDYDILQSLM